jgi:AcrR family transcriptional regulator
MEMKKRPARLGRPPKQEARNTRECILNAAIELFAAQGFAGTSLRQIAQVVGIKESAIYAHFESKEALYRTIFEQVGPPLAIADELLGPDPSVIARQEPEKILREFAYRVIGRWNEPQAKLFSCLALRDRATSKQLIHSTIVQIIERLAPIFQQWIDRGRIRGDFPAKHLAWELLAPLALIRIAHWHAQATEEEQALGHRLAYLHIDYFLHTVLTAPTGNERENPDSHNPVTES